MHNIESGGSNDNGDDEDVVDGDVDLLIGVMTHLLGGSWYYKRIKIYEDVVDGFVEDDDDIEEDVDC